MKDKAKLPENPTQRPQMQTSPAEAVRKYPATYRSKLFSTIKTQIAPVYDQPVFSAAKASDDQTPVLHDKESDGSEDENF